MLRPGDPAPDFELPDQTGKTVRLRDLHGKSAVVLIFYPADNTPGCTKQLCAARDDYALYEQAGIAAFGVNPGSAETHRRFSERYSFRTPLLVDEGGRVCRAYDVLMPIPLLTVVIRTVVGIDRDGVIRYYRRGMPATSEIIEAMTGGAAVPA